MADSSILLVFSKTEVAAKLTTMLNAGGLRIAGSCCSGAEAMRLSVDMERVLVITSVKLPDMTAEELYLMLPPDAGMVVIGKGQQREMIMNDDIVFLPLPVHKDELCRTVRIALGEYGIRRKPPRPVRTEEENKIIADTKHLLMEKYMMSEMQAHRFIQKQSMDHGLKFIDTARQILAHED